MYFYINGYKQGVVVDDYLPVDSDGDPAFGHSKRPEIWVSLLEKAWAKLNGSYSRCDGGFASVPAHYLTGCPSFYLENSNTELEVLWDMI